MPSQDYVLPITKMAYINKQYPSVNYSGSDRVTVGRHYDANYVKYAQMHAYMLAEGLPDLVGVTLTNLKLNFTLVSGTNEEGIYVGFYAPYDPWSETAVCWNNRPLYQSAIASDIIPTGKHSISLNVGTSLYNAIRQYGASIQDSGGAFNAEMQIYSHLATDPANRPYFSFTITESIPSAVPVTPMKTFVDVTADTLFMWEYINAAGGVQKSYEIEISPDGTNWESLSSGITPETSVIVPANTMSASDRYWRVKVVSENDAESPWSSAVEIKAVASPTCMLGVVTETPRPNVSWICEGQIGYQVKIGSYDSGVQFGTTKEFRCPIYLSDGEYEVSVRVQGAYSLWSQWSSQTITVENVPGDAIVLIGFPSHHARLSWSGGGDGDFYILRDGVPIGKTDANEYTDSFVIGKHSYQVLEQLADGNYTLSNKVTMTLVAPNNMISPVSAAVWQDLKYSLDKSPTFGESHAQTGAFIHYAGRKYPVFESSGFEDKTLSFTVAFKTQKEATEFGQLLGQTVCYKSKIGRMIIGILDSYSVETNRRYSQYSFTIKQTDYREEIAYE
jgi:hypothetical protein